MKAPAIPALTGSRTFWRRAFQSALDVFYPPRCAACVARMESPAAGDFCGACGDVLEPITGPRCRICSEPFPGRITESFSCPNCSGLSFAFESAISAWHCSGPVREAIHRFKYGREIHLRLALAHKLLDALDDPRFPAWGWVGEQKGTEDRKGGDGDAEQEVEDRGSGTSDKTGVAVSLTPEVSPAGNQSGPAEEAETGSRTATTNPALGWLLVPVPLHARRFRERRFNQSAELARTLAKLTGLPCQDLLRRTRYTTAQAALNRQQRLKNLAGAFVAEPRSPLEPHAGVLLVDDVFTTGSTAHECATALKKAGARRVIVLTVARG